VAIGGSGAYGWRGGWRRAAAQSARRVKWHHHGGAVGIAAHRVIIGIIIGGASWRGAAWRHITLGGGGVGMAWRHQTLNMRALAIA